MTCKRAIIYTRYSPRPAGCEGESAELQAERCRKYCEARSQPVLAVYSDNGVSGKNDDRPQFQLAMAEAEKHKAVLVVYSLSRFARNTKDALVNFDRLRKAGAALAGLCESIDTSTPMGKYVFTLIAALAELEPAQISERTKAAMLRYQEERRKIMGSGRTLPYGRMRDPDHPRQWIENPQEQENIRAMLRLWSRLDHERGALAAVAKDMNRSGCFNRSGKPWTPKQISRILQREGVKPNDNRLLIHLKKPVKE